MSQNSQLKQATLVFLRKMVGEETHICLALKKRGFAMGKWNGVGGKVERGESIEQAAVRETAEEILVKVMLKDLQLVAKLDFIFEDKPEWGQRVHVFFVDHWQGEPSESEEMMPKWYKISEIPYDQMWQDDRYWLPKVLHGEKVQGEFHFGADERILSSNVVTTNLHELVLSN